MSQVSNFQMRGTILALVGVLMFSTKSVFAKMALAVSDDFLAVLFLRVSIGFPIVLVITLITWFKHKDEHKKFIKDYVAVFFLALLGYYISSLFDFSGLQYIEASIERIVLFLYPTFVIILSAIFLKQGISFKQILAIVVCYIGLIVVFSDKMHIENTGLFWKGVFLVIGSAFTYSIFLTASNKYIPRIGPTMFTNIALISITIAIITHYSIAGETNVIELPSRFWVVCGLMSTIGTIIPAYLFNTAIKYLGASNVSIVSSLGPIETMIMSSILLSEQILVIQIVGTIIVIFGILILKISPAEVVRVVTVSVKTKFQGLNKSFFKVV